MSITSGFFNSVNGDRKYNADDMSNYFEGLISYGVIANPSTSLQVIADGTSMDVQVQPGRGIINNRWMKNSAVETLTIGAADALLNRIDAIVMRYSVSDRVITLNIKQGTPATSPIAPVMSRSENTVEYCLATIYIAAGATKISQANVTDTRPNSAVCGFVTNLVDNIDITKLYAQWEVIFMENMEAAEEKAMQDYLALTVDYSTLKFNYEAELKRRQDEFDAWYVSVKETLTVPTKVVKYENSYTTTGSTTSFNMGIPQYETGDAIIIHLGGILLTESEYTVSGTGEEATITFPTAASSGRTYTVIVFKAIV